MGTRLGEEGIGFPIEEPIDAPTEKPTPSIVE
jgi:hypothetical protein